MCASLHAQQGGLTVHAPDVQSRFKPVIIQPRHACFSNGIIDFGCPAGEWACYERLCAH
jgi:hypothetical protein